MSGDLAALAAQAYLYGFPLVFDLEQVERVVAEGIGDNPPTPFNSFGHARKLATAKDTFVSINNDTLYSMASLDLSAGPMILHLPDSGGRYCVMQFVDAWTNNFAYVGQRATGSGPGDYFIVPPGWTGQAPHGTRVIESPTRIVSIVGRRVCDPADLAAVHDLQDATTLTPAHPGIAVTGLPPAGTDLEPALAFFDRYRVWSQAFPPAERDAALQASFAPLGLTGTTPVDQLPGEQRAALITGYAQGQAMLEASLRSGNPTVNGWSMTLHVFDYNLDFFQVGALDDPAWKITDPQRRILVRAGAAKGGLWGNHGYEAAYLMTYVDADGQQLNGANTYTLTLDPPPPVGAFWSLTMYDTTNFYLVDNPIDRYSIGDRTPGVVYDPKGAFTITISHAEPADATARANWLPAPEGDFRPILRMYIPDQAILDGTYQVPAIQREP